MIGTFRAITYYRRNIHRTVRKSESLLGFGICVTLDTVPKITATVYWRLILYQAKRSMNPCAQ